MPYISQSRRDEIDAELRAQGSLWTPGNAGDLNYLVSFATANFITKNGLPADDIIEMIGALECCKMELYRVLSGSHEDTRIAENGRVHPPVPDPK